MDGPRQGDVFGELLRDALAVRTGVGPRPLVGGRLPRPVIEIIERDDGLINGAPAEHYLDGPEQWEPYDHRAVRPGVRRGARRRRGRRADRPGAAGARRVGDRAGYLARSGTGGAGAWCAGSRLRHRRRARGQGARYDTFLLLGNNLGLLEGRERAPEFLAALAAMARPGAQIIAQGTDPYGTTDPVHLTYHERNRRRGRLGGQLRLRLRYRELSTGWFDYLVCSTDELGQIVAGTPWRLVDIDNADAPFYLATLRLVGP